MTVHHLRGRSRVAWLVLSCLALIPISSSSRVGAQARGLSAETIQRIEKTISSEMSQQNIPSLSVAVAVDNELRWTNGYGMADLENFVPAKAATAYRVASVTKPMTATAVLQLVEQGRMALDAPVQTYVPSFPKKPWPITIRHLLTHQSGIRHYQGQEIDSTRHYNTLVEALEIFKNDPLLFQPGTGYSYSTYAYTLLGAALESASGAQYIDYLRDRVFAPAGMDQTRLDEVAAIIPNRAQGYRSMQNGTLRNSGLADTSYKIPAGGLSSTAADLVRFACALDKGLLVRRATLDQMWTIQTLDAKPDPGNPTRASQPRQTQPPLSYGFGWIITERNGEKEVWHTGGQQRTSTVLLVRPARHLAIAVMANLEGARVLDLARRLGDVVFDDWPRALPRP